MTYLDTIADAIRAEVPERVIPDGDTGLLFRLYAVLALAKGADVSVADVHNAWAAWMTTIEPAHESIKPYDSLEGDVKREDRPFVDAIRRVAETCCGADATS
jgi:hypothetical protein